MFGKYSNKVATAGNDYYLKLRERFSGTIKCFLSRKLRNIELYATAGLKVKYMKYNFIQQNDETNEHYLSQQTLQSKKKTHFVPVLGCGLNIPFKDSWFARCEYMFEFPCKCSPKIKVKTLLEPAMVPASQDTIGCKTIKHNVHNIRLGVGKYF